MIVIIIILVGLFLWWSLTPPKNKIQTIPNPYLNYTPISTHQEFRKYIMKLMYNTIRENRKPVKHLNRLDQLVYILKALEACKDYLIRNAHVYTVQYKITIEDVKNIIEQSYDESMERIKY